MDEPLPRGFADVSQSSRTILDRNSVPRDRAHRFRLYRLYRGKLELIATAPTPGQLGQRIVTLGRKGFEFAGSTIGILDTHGTDASEGSWILNPWDTKPRREKE